MILKEKEHIEYLWKWGRIMDAVKFINEYRRICSLKSCMECPLNEVGCPITVQKEKAEEIVDIVEKWSTEHPLKTRQSEFLKLFPNALWSDDGVLRIRPCDIDTKKHRMTGEFCENVNTNCGKCRKMFWLEPLD